MEYERLVCFGDNCEVGFIFDALGYTEGHVFKWTTQKVEDLLNVVKNDFSNFFEFENLIAIEDACIRDLGTNIAFHSNIYSRLDENGQRVFSQDLETRKAIFADQKSKLNYLIDKFRTKLLDPNAKNIFVSKSFTGFNPAVYQTAVDVIKNYCGHDDFKVLFITANPAVPHAVVDVVSKNILVAEMPYFAEPITAHLGDLKNWKRLLDTALSIK